MTTAAILQEVKEEVKPLAASLVQDIENVVRQAEDAEERPVLYYTSPAPGVMYYSLRPTEPA